MFERSKISSKGMTRCAYIHTHTNFQAHSVSRSFSLPLVQCFVRSFVHSLLPRVWMYYVICSCACMVGWLKLTWNRINLVCMLGDPFYFTTKKKLLLADLWLLREPKRVQYDAVTAAVVVVVVAVAATAAAASGTISRHRHWMSHKYENEIKICVQKARWQDGLTIIMMKSENSLQAWAWMHFLSFPRKKPNTNINEKKICIKLFIIVMHKKKIK